MTFQMLLMLFLSVYFPMQKVNPSDNQMIMELWAK